MFERTRLLFLAATFFCGLAMAFMYPLISLYLVDELNSSPIQMGGFLATMVICGVIASTYIGKKSDQGWPRKRILFVAQLCFSSAMLVFIFTRHIGFALAAAAFLLSINSSTLPQIFTLGRLYSDKKITKGGSLFMSLMRAGIAVAWVVGPPLAFLVKEQFGFNIAFTVSIVSALMMIVIVSLLPEYTADQSSTHKTAGTFSWVKVPNVVFFLASTVLMFSAAHMYVTSLPLFITKELLLPGQWAGYLMGLAAFIEIPFMVVAGIYGPKLGNRRLMIMALVSGAVFFFGLLWSESVISLMVLQIFNGIFIAVTACLGMLFIQDIMKTQMGLATTLFTSAQQVSMLVGSLSVGLVAQFFSYYAVFVVCFIVVFLALLLLLLVRDKEHDTIESLQTENKMKLACSS
jgi:SET family sugar efflux transporter-like MFS transporter